MHIAQEYKEMGALQESYIPKIGFIAYSNTEYQYVAAGFLRMVEGGFGQLDTFVTNPSIAPHIRNEAIILITDKLIETAKSLKLTGIYAFTADKSIISRAEATGFRVKNQSVITLLL
jgi:hypothetical protein